MNEFRDELVLVKRDLCFRAFDKDIIPFDCAVLLFFALRSEDREI